MRQKLFLLIVTLPSFFLKVESQVNGINFEHGLTWEQIIKKAKNEKKYIFVDCYATWCKPCKEMDKTVFEDSTVATLMNERFVSVKIQMDSAKIDNENIRMLIPTAREFERKYNIAALPTFLFFSSDGRILHREIGKIEISKFISLVNDAMNPEKQLYSLIGRWKAEQLKDEQLLQLSETLKKYHEDSLSLQVARDYMLKYLDKLPDSGLLQKSNLVFLRQNAKMINPQDRVFKMLYRQGIKVDSIIGQRGYSEHFAEFVIYNVEIYPYLKDAKLNNHEPDWRKLTKQIETKFSEKDAVQNIIKAKVYWYKDQKNWKNYTKWLAIQMKQEHLSQLLVDEGAAIYLNGMANEIFTYSNKPSELKLALAWSNFAISKCLSSQIMGALLDTKANILYKLGKREDALKLYSHVIEFNPSYSVFYKCIEMGLPTWLKPIWPPLMERKKDDAKLLQAKIAEERIKPIDKQIIPLEFIKIPDFSGQWEIDYFKSEFNGLPGYAATKRFVIHQKRDSITIERFSINAPGIERYSKVNFKIDGNEIISRNNSGQIQSVQGEWIYDKYGLTTITLLRSDESNKQIETKRIQKWMLSKGGKILIVQQDTEVAGNTHPYSIIAVYRKK